MLERFRKQLKLSGYSLTKPRQYVFLALAERAYSMPELLSRFHDKIDRASLYRILWLFEQLQIIQIVGQGRNRRFELTDNYSNHHHHLNCTKCGRIETIEAPKIEIDLMLLARSHEFTLVSHQLELSGICRDCNTGSMS